VHFVLQSQSNEAPAVEFYCRQPLSLSPAPNYSSIPKGVPVSKSMHIAFMDQKQYEPVSVVCCLSSLLLPSFHFLLFILLWAPVACTPFHLIFSGCQAATLPSYDSSQKLERKLLREEIGRQPTGRRCGGGGGHVCVIPLWGQRQRLQGVCKKCWQQQGLGGGVEGEKRREWKRIIWEGQRRL